MAGNCTLVLYFHSPAACENTAAHSCNIQPYIYIMYMKNRNSTHVCGVAHARPNYTPWTELCISPSQQTWTVLLPSMLVRCLVKLNRQIFVLVSINSAVLSRASAHGLSQLKRQKLGVGGYTEKVLEWFNYPRARAYPGCELNCQGVPLRASSRPARHWRKLYCATKLTD